MSCEEFLLMIYENKLADGEQSVYRISTLKTDIIKFRTQHLFR